MGQNLASETYHVLAAATRTAVKKAGGSTFVGEEVFGGTARQNVERYYSTNENESTRSMPLFRVAELEDELNSAGHAPYITRTLADLHGYDLVPRPEHAASNHPVTAISRLLEEAGSACGTVTDAMSDGNLSADDKRKCAAELQKLIAEASETLGSLAASDCEVD